MTPGTSAGPPPRAAKRGRRRWAWCGAAALVLVLAAAGAGVWWWRRPAPVDPPMPADIQDAEVRNAIARARQEVLAKPRSGDAWGNLGMTLLAHLFEREADRCFAEAGSRAPADPRWPYGRGLIAMKHERDRAESFLRQASAIADSWPEGRSALRLRLAEVLLERQELDEAEGLFRDELRRGSGGARAAFGLALVAQARGNEKAATEYLNAARASPFARKKATAQLAVLARGRGDVAAAAEFEKEIGALPDDQPWLDTFVYEMRELAVGHWKWEREVAQLERERRFAEAARIYLQQIEVQPTSRAYIGAGSNLARTHDYARAVPLLREAVRLDPDNANAHYTLALAHYSRAKKELERSPNSPLAKDWLRAVVEHARRAAELQPDLARAYLFWGLALQDLGEPAKAVEPFRRGVACRPELFDLQLGLGEALLDSGQDLEAETYLENARRLNPQNPRPAQDVERLQRKKN